MVSLSPDRLLNFQEALTPMSAFLVLATAAPTRPSSRRCPAATQGQATLGLQKPECVSSLSSAVEVTSPDSRRTFLIAGLCASLSCATARPSAAETTAPPEALETQPTSSDADIFETTDFYLRIPRQFSQVADDPLPQQRLGRGQAPPQTPLKARFLSETTGAQVTVVSREAFQIKTLLFQCQDISQLGSPSEVSRKILPPGAKLLSATSAEITEPDRDLSAFQGFVQQPRQTIYRYEFETMGGLRVTMAAAARVGKIFFAGGTAPVAGWSSAAPDLLQAVGSFRLLQASRNV